MNSNDTLSIQNLFINRQSSDNSGTEWMGLSVKMERGLAGGFLVFVVILQALNAFTFSVQSSKGKRGRFYYYLAFAYTVIHDFFIGIIVPSAILWVAYELAFASLQIEPLTTTILGALWYGPERVQSSISNLLRLKKRRHILIAALAAYHRSKHEYDCATGTWTIVRYERRLPLWISRYSRKKIYHLTNVIRDDLNHNCDHNHQIHEYTKTVIVKKRSCVVRRATDTYLRSIAREGVRMAFTGEFTDNDLRDWYIYLIADQARFALSPLDSTEPSIVAPEEHSGYGAIRMRRRVEDVHSNWTYDQRRRLITVYEGLRQYGSFRYLVEQGWILL